MRISEIMESMGGTCAGGIATVSMPIGSVLSRTNSSLLSGKYTEVGEPKVSPPKKKGKRCVK